METTQEWVTETRLQVVGWLLSLRGGYDEIQTT